MLKKIARIISNVFAPPFVAIPVIVAICLGTAPTRSLGLIWLVTTVMGACIIPVVIILISVRLGYLKDFHITDRKQRPLFLLGGIIILAITNGILIMEHPSRLLLLSFISVFVGMLVFTLITLRWKISFHVGGITMVIVVMNLIFGQKWLYLSPLILLIAWARLKLYAHTQLQLIAGALAGCVVPLLVFIVASKIH